MKLELDKRFQKKIRGTFERYSFEVGVLEDKPYNKPAIGAHGLKGQDVLTTYAGVTVRKATRKPSGLNISDISAANRLKYNYLIQPFREKSSDINKLIKEFFRFAFGRSERKRLENTLQAVVRNPILRKDYGENAPLTKTIKGFSHAMMDTAQLFKNIKARVKNV